MEEDESICPDARTLVARFNEQIEPIYALLRETEDVNLSHDLLEPEPSEIPALKQRSLRKNSLFHCIYTQILLDFFFYYLHALISQLMDVHSILSSSRERAAASAANAAGGPHREAWSNKSSAYADLYTQNVVISMEEQEEQQKQAAQGRAAKERPVWLTQSTVHGAYSESDVLKNRK